MTTQINYSDLYQSFENDFKQILKDLKQDFQSMNVKNQQYISLNQQQKWNEMIESANKCVNLNISKIQLRQMEVEALSMPPSFKKKMQEQNKRYIDSLNNYQNLINSYDLEDEVTDAKVIYQSRYISQHDRLLQTGEEVQYHGDLINEMERSAEETHQLASHTYQNLKKDKFSLQRSLDHNKEIESQLKKTHLIVDVMNRRLIVDKWVLVFIVILLGLANLLVFFWKIT